MFSRHNFLASTACGVCLKTELLLGSTKLQNRDTVTCLQIPARLYKVSANLDHACSTCVCQRIWTIHAAHALGTDAASFRLSPLAAPCQGVVRASLCVCLHEPFTAGATRADRFLQASSFWGLFILHSWNVKVPCQAIQGLLSGHLGEEK